MDNKEIKFNISDNEFVLNFKEEAELKDLSFKVIRSNDKSLDIAWSEKDNCFHWVNSGPDLVFRLLYPGRPIIGEARFFLNPCLTNFLQKVGQNTVLEAQVFNKKKLIACSRFNVMDLPHQRETEASIKCAREGISATIEVLLGETPEPLSGVWKDTDVSPEQTEYEDNMDLNAEDEMPESENSEIENLNSQMNYAEENNSAYYDNEFIPSQHLQQRLDSFFYHIDSSDDGNVISDKKLNWCFGVGIAAGILVSILLIFNYCFLKNLNYDNAVLNLLPRSGSTDQASESISFYWVLFTVAVYSLALWFKRKKVLNENGCKAQIVNNLLFKEIRSNTRNFKEIADSAVSELATKEKMQFLNLFSNSLVEYRCGDYKAYGCKDSAAEYFNEETVGSSNLHYSRMIMPAILTAIGVLGTFVGLLLSLTSLRDYGIGADSADMVPQIKELIKGASTAFITSIWGVIFSIVYTMVISCAKHFSSDTIKQLQQNLDSVFYPYLNSEDKDSVQVAIKKLGIKITSKLEQNATEIADNIGQAITKYVADVNDHTVGIVKDVVREFQQRFLAILENQSNGLENAAQKLVKAQDAAAEHVRAKYQQWEMEHKSLIDEVKKEYAKIQSDATKYVAQLQNVGQNFENINNSFQNFSGLYQQMLEVSNRNQQTMEKFISDVNSKIESLNKIFADATLYQEKIAEYSEFFKEFFSNQKTFQSTLQDMIVHMNESNNQIVKLKDGLSFCLDIEYNRIRELIKETNDNNKDLLKRNIDELNSCWIDVVKDNMDRLKDAFDNLRQVNGISSNMK